VQSWCVVPSQVLCCQAYTPVVPELRAGSGLWGKSGPAFDSLVTPGLWWPPWEHLAIWQSPQVMVLYDTPDHFKSERLYLYSQWRWDRERNLRKTYFLPNFCICMSKITVKLQYFWKIVSHSKKSESFFSVLWDVFMETFEADSNFFLALFLFHLGNYWSHGLAYSSPLVFH